MSDTKFYKATSKIFKGGWDSQDSLPAVTEGRKVRFLGLPTKADGSIDLDGQNLSFEGSIDGSYFFTILDYSGAPLVIPARAANKVKSGIGLATGKAHLPLRSPELFEGIFMIRVVSDRTETKDREIDFYVQSD